jgi:hypothetical protein
VANFYRLRCFTLNSAQGGPRREFMQRCFHINAGIAWFTRVFFASFGAAAPSHHNAGIEISQRPWSVHIEQKQRRIRVGGTGAVWLNLNMHSDAFD